MVRKFTARLVLVLSFAVLTLPTPKLVAQSNIITGSDPQPGQPSVSIANAILPVLIAAATS